MARRWLKQTKIIQILDELFSELKRYMNHCLDSSKSENEKSSVIPVIEFNPVQHLLGELNTCYGQLARFYYDKYGGMVIAVKLKQVALNILFLLLAWEPSFALTLPNDLLTKSCPQY